MKAPSRLIFVEFIDVIIGEDLKVKEDQWLQITSVSNIGDISREVKQKIIRLNDEDQRKLYEMLKAKYEVKS